MRNILDIQLVDFIVIFFFMRLPTAHGSPRVLVNYEKGGVMKNLRFVGWLAFVLWVAWFAYHRWQSKPLNADCQHYDRLGRGIGCEGSDLGDM
jgi:hypothetical protein